MLNTYSLRICIRFFHMLFTVIGVVARNSPWAPPPSLPLASTEASTLSSAHAASSGPQLSADPCRLSNRWSGSCCRGDDTGKAPSDNSCHRLLAVVLRLIGQDRRKVVVGSRCEVDRIILPPCGESSTACEGTQVLAAVEAAEWVESCNGEAVLLPFGLEDIEAGGAAPQENVGEVRLRPVHHVLLITSAGALYIAWKRQHTDDGGAAYHLQEVPDEAEALPVRSPGIRSSGKILRRF